MYPKPAKRNQRSTRRPDTNRNFGLLNGRIKAIVLALLLLMLLGIVHLLTTRRIQDIAAKPQVPLTAVPDVELPLVQQLSASHQQQEYDKMMADKNWFDGLSDECQDWLSSWKSQKSFASQVGQDWWLFANLFRGKRDGFFLDIGAYNPKTMSNSYFFEKCLGWKGICVEANPTEAALFQGTRQCILENVCISNTAEHLYLEPIPGGSKAYPQAPNEAEINRLKLIKIPCMSLDALLEKHKVQHVDFMSLDVEGFEERVLNAFSGWNKVDFIVMEMIWSNVHLQWLMADQGFYRITDVGGLDDVYMRMPKLLPTMDQAGDRQRTYSGFSAQQKSTGKCVNGG
jgi:FkbM family methyltransferase